MCSSITILAILVITATTLSQQASSQLETSKSAPDSNTAGNVTATEKFENITHGGGPGAGATTYSER